MDLRKIVSGMTLKQKAAQLTQLGAPFVDSAAALELTGPIQQMGLTKEDIASCGSVLNTDGPESRIRIQNEHLAKDPNKIPLVFMQDVIHGYRTIYPIPLAMAASFNPELMRECAAMAGREAVTTGVDVAFSPMVDMSRDARWGRVMEGAGEDVLLGCDMARAQVLGYADAGMQSCVKHYAGYGAGEAGREYNTVDMSESRLREHYLPAYKAALDAGARCIMPSFNSMNGVPSVGNEHLMNEILRGEWGFDGVVVSDYSAVVELIAHGVAEDKAQAAELALRCGCDLEMMSACYVQSIEKLLAEGRVTMEQIDACVLRVLKLKEELGLFEAPQGHADPEAYAAVCGCEEHHEIARRAAEQTAVLLKNDGLLPLQEMKKIAVIGPYADDPDCRGAWSINGRPEETVTVLQGIRARWPGSEVRCAKGCSGELLTDDESGLAEAGELAAWADAVILVIGESGEHSGESNGRARLELPDVQRRLFETVTEKNGSVAVVLMAGRPLAIPELDEKARAILCMWQPGSEGGTACARLLWGDVDPQGHLPMTFPRATGQEPISYDIYSTGRQVPDMLHSMGFKYQSRWLDVPVAPLYPFGYGLGYTTFELTEPALSADAMTPGTTIEASCTVRNTGDRRGTTLVQLYLHDLVGSVVRPVRQLKAYRKITLEPGEERRVRFMIDEPMLRFQTLANGYASEPGRFEAIMAFDAMSGEKLPFELKDA